MKLSSQAINNARDALRDAEVSRRDTVRRIQLRCHHKQVAECDYRSSDHGSACPPIRVCLHCGMTEMGWGCGYLVLGPRHAASDVSRIDRDELYRLRQGLFIQDDDKGPLIRQQSTVGDLIRKPSIWI